MAEEAKNTLLIVDDENVNLKILSHILSTEYTIFTANNGNKALEKAKELKPDLILLDIIMPEMDGYETLSMLKDSEETKNIPVIFITGLSNDMDEEKGLSLEAADYIAKPFSAMIVKLRVKHQIKLINQQRMIDRLSKIDLLTDLPNKFFFDEHFSVEWKQAIANKTPVSLLIIDIDKFRYCNEIYGHTKGDAVLQTIAKIYSVSIQRPGDFAARLGGEEFAVILPDTQLESAMEIAEKLRKEIENTEIPNEGGTPIKVTVSIGVNTQTPVQESSDDAFISGAEKALYSAKDAGRNKVMAA